MKKLGIMGAMLMSGAAFAADGIKMGGFVDAQWGWEKVGNADATNGFSVPDGAFYFGKTLGMGEVMVDMPFQALDLSGENYLLAGKEKAQAFVTWKYDNGFNWKLGQFDYTLGLEANDSADRKFSHEGIVAGMFPVTSTGLELGYDMSDAMGFKVLYANQANNATRTTTLPYDMGFTLWSDSDAFNAKLGAVFTKAAAENQAMGWTFDVQAGTKAGNIGLDFELVFKKISVASGATAETQIGFLALADFEIGENASFGVRPEYVKNGDASTMAAAIGPHFTMSKDLNVRLDYSYKSHNNGLAGATATVTHGLALNAVHRF